MASPNPSRIDGNDNNPLTDQMDGILQLMDQRARGQASNDQVEAAVSNVLDSMGAKPASSSSNTSNGERKRPRPTTRPEEPAIQVDMGNYDDDDDDDDDDNVDDNKKKKRSNAESSKSQKEPPKGSEENSSLQSTLLPDSEYKELLEDIPMGKVGAQMMTAFGDGPQPKLDTLQSVLKATRLTMQYTVMDARALRRKLQAQFSQAKVEALTGKKNFSLTKTAPLQNDKPVDDTAEKLRDSSHTSNSTPEAAKSKRKQQGVHSFDRADPALMYRVLLTDQAKRHDPLAKQPKCGFDIEQLSSLYPEESRAYERWNELHSEYKDSKVNDNIKQVKDDTVGEDGDSNRDGPVWDKSITEDQVDGDDYEGGHLKERAAVFNIRTDQMPQDGYLKFSRVRRGSFLPSRYRRSQLEKEWDSQEIGRGRSKSGDWQHMPAVAVRFLHWLGFDPPQVPPPNSETTHFLAFLAHDRLGRIVEKAVYLRNVNRRKANIRGNNDVQDNNDDDGDIDNPSSAALRELQAGEHLAPEDIDIALQDPDAKPTPLFPIEGDFHSAPANAQLYFGPGFEQRLELELEEMMASSKKKTIKDGLDDTIQKQEKEFLEKMSKPPDAISWQSLMQKEKGDVENIEQEDLEGDMDYVDEVKDEESDLSRGHQDSNSTEDMRRQSSRLKSRAE